MRREPELDHLAPALEPGPAPAGRRLARLVFVLSLTPGAVITMVLTPALKSPVLLATGMVLLLAAFLAHGRLTAAILARAARDDVPDAAARPQSPESL